MRLQKGINFSRLAHSKPVFETVFIEVGTIILCLLISHKNIPQPSLEFPSLSKDLILHVSNLCGLVYMTL